MRVPALGLLSGIYRVPLELGRIGLFRVGSGAGGTYWRRLFARGLASAAADNAAQPLIRLESARMSIKSFIRTIPDHPQPGIQFRDITTLLLDPKGLKLAVDQLCEPYVDGRLVAPDLVVGIEARGFLFGTAIAYQLGAGFVPLRKPGKLPGEKIGRDFDLEYGSDRIEIHVDALLPGQRVLLVDDLIATGGTAEAAIGLIQSCEAELIETAFVVALPDLGGVKRLEALGCSVRWLCEFAGD